MTEEQENIILIKYNKERNWFEAYMPDGTLIPKQFIAKITDSVNEPMTITITAKCKFVES